MLVIYLSARNHRKIVINHIVYVKGFGNMKLFPWLQKRNRKTLITPYINSEKGMNSVSARLFQVPSKTERIVGLSLKKILVTVEIPTYILIVIATKY